MAEENPAASAAAQLRRGKTIEQIYQKKTQLEHILLRPDTYVGSIEHQLQEMWIWDEARKQMVYRRIDYVPALYKIFDEILVNAADNSMRDPKGMDLIEVTIDRQQGCVSVLNNGQGIPVQVHKEHKCYVPELIFGHLLTSDNYDDNEKKVTGGRNGYGAKLTNVFSKKFAVETADKTSKKRFVQVFEKNMTVKNPPEVTDYKGSEYTRVTFWPDFARFGMVGLDSDITGLMMKRVYDIAGSTERKVRVVLNGEQLPIKCFQDYVNLYISKTPVTEGGELPPVIYERCGERWEVAVSVSDGNFQQVSFVNSINTIKGGTHVAHVSDQLVEAIQKVVKGKNRGGIDIKPAHVRNHLSVFINCLIENPAFDSQTKETLTTKQSKFGSTCEISDKMMKQVMKSGVVELILDWAKAKQKVDLSRQLRGANKNMTRVLGIPKLEDANDAGGKNSQDCTLILTEGDSAKSLAVAGLAVVGRDKYGVFPLKGKVLNVRDANFKQVSGNTEIQNLLKIMGLDLKCEYNNTSKLRYGSIMLMTDQDHDGSHIKGLLINLVHFWWPSLVRMDGFLKEFITPIVKVWKEGKKDSERREETSFFTVMEYEDWKRKNDNGKGWKSKYYKGLGTSTMKEAKEYFRDIEQHEIRFKWAGDQDGEAIDLAFNKKRADDRKDWINAYEDGTYVDHSKSVVGYSDFVHKELVQFAKYDVLRSVPSVVDGFKPSQRKVIFCSFKKRLKNDIKVAQFVGYISEQSAYHHGEASLENTIVNLAQNFVGSNNVNLLVPSGQFGTRLQGGKDHAASRYIYTRLHPVTRAIFHPDDDPVLNYLDEEGLSIEPKWYCPVLPTVLMNGADGIGVGWSTFIPNYNPRDIVRNIRRMLRGEPMTEMHPWYKGFRGSIVPNEREPGKYEVTGTAEKKSDTTIEITELPIKTWTQNYKEFLEELMPNDGKKSEESDHTIEDFREYHTESMVHFVLTLSPAKMREVEKAGFEKTFKLKTSMATSNMVLFDAEGKIAKYNTSLDILRDFCQLRRTMYVKRKGYLVAKLTREKEILSNKARFILMVVKGELEIRRKKKADLLLELKDLKFTPMSKLDALMEGKCSSEAPAAPEVDEDAAPVAPGKGGVERTEYDYLLGMNLWSLTFERVEEIKKQLEVKKEELAVLEATTIETMWDRDLEALSKMLDDMDAQEEEEAAATASVAEGRKRRKMGGGRGGGRPPTPATASTPMPPKRVPAPPRSDEFSGKPLVQCEDTIARSLGEVQKTTWGVGGAQTVGGGPGVASSALSGAGSVRKRLAAPPLTASNISGGRPTAPAAPAAAAAPPPDSIGDDGGAGLLRRLMRRQDSDGAQPRAPAPPSGPIELGGSEDFFSYLKPTPSVSQISGVVDLESSSQASHRSLASSAPGSTAGGRGGGPGKGKGRGRGQGQQQVDDGGDDIQFVDRGPSAPVPAARPTAPPGAGSGGGLSSTFAFFSSSSSASSAPPASRPTVPARAVSAPVSSSAPSSNAAPSGLARLFGGARPAAQALPAAPAAPAMDPAQRSARRRAGPVAIDSDSDGGGAASVPKRRRKRTVLDDDEDYEESP